MQVFDPRQSMTKGDFEIFHYRDAKFEGVAVHQHDFYEVYFFISGNVEYSVEGKSYLLKEGDLLLINPLELHQPRIGPDQNAYERQDHHGKLHDPDGQVGRGSNDLGRVCGVGTRRVGNHVDARDDQREGDDALAGRAAELVDEGLNGKAGRFISFSELPLAILYRVGQEQEHEKLDEGLREEEPETRDDDQREKFE